MEWWLWLIIIGSILVVGVILFLLLAGGDEEVAAEEAAEEVAPPDYEELFNWDEFKGELGVNHDIAVGETQFWSISAKPKKGYAWITDAEECDTYIDFEILEDRPVKEPAKKEGDEAKKGDKKDEKDEKKLRDGHEKDEKKDAEAEKDVLYMKVTGKIMGKCSFEIVYAESWDWDKDGSPVRADEKDAVGINALTF